MVYFIQAGDDGPIKIGFSGDPAKRLSSLQTANPQPLRLIGVLPGGKDVEATMHSAFSSHRLRGEWFNPDPSILGLLDQLTAAHAYEAHDFILSATERVRALLKGGAAAVHLSTLYGSASELHGLLKSVQPQPASPADDPWKQPFSEFLGSRGEPITTAGLLELMTGTPEVQQSRASQMRAATILKDLGWSAKRTYRKGVRQRFWSPPTSRRAQDGDTKIAKAGAEQERLDSVVPDLGAWSQFTKDFK